MKKLFLFCGLIFCGGFAQASGERATAVMVSSGSLSSQATYFFQTGNQLNFRLGNSTAAVINSTGITTTQINATTVTATVQLTAPGATQNIPAFAFAGNTTTGLYQPDGATTAAIGLTGGGVQLARFGGGNNQSNANWLPSVDNTYKCGQLAFRWTELWATLGTVQTSHSSFKYNFVPVDPSKYRVPDAVFYNWKDRKGKPDDRPYLGWLADSLPKEAYEWDKDGKPILSGVHESAVVGILCAHVKDLEKKTTNQLYVIYALLVLVGLSFVLHIKSRRS
jgi:hypothetical protein